MDAVLRALVMYFILLAIIRAGGKRTVAQLTTFDSVLLMVIGESTQQAILGNDFSITNAVIVIVSLVTVDLILASLTRKFPRLSAVSEGYPLIIAQDGKPLDHRLKQTRIAKDDILEAGRRLRGIERMEQVKYAVLERDGSITIIPTVDSSTPPPIRIAAAPEKAAV